MNPINDIVCNLLETPFSHWKEEDKKDVLKQGRPTVVLAISAKKDLKCSGKSYNLKFKISWFTEYNWLCSSPILQKLFCWPCLLFCTKQSVWNREGFADLLNITRALHKHADSKDHLICALKLKNFEKNQSTVGDALKENARLFKAQFNENVRLNRRFLERVIDVVLYLSKQELAFHGHDESKSANRGNFEELLTLLISRSPIEIKTHEKIKNVFNGDSKIIQNELIHCISDYIDDYVKDEINNTDFFSIQVDDTTDITQTSQCSLIIRFINPGGEVIERFLGFHNVNADRTSTALYDLLVNILQHFDFEQKLIGQCYDGASVMSGHLNGLQQKIKDRVPQAIFVHCLAHRLNLVLQQSFKKIPQCRIFFASLSGIPSFFNTAKRTYTLISTTTKHMPTVETRWSSNSKLVHVIIEDWNKLKEVFELIIISESSDKKSLHLAKGFLNDFNNFEFTFLAVVFNDLFSLTDILFDVLQKKSLDVNFCVTKINETIELIKRKKNDDLFETIFEKTNETTQIVSEQEYASLTNDDIRRKYRMLLYEILDHIVMEMEVRFQDHDKLQFMSLADTTKFEQYKSYFPSKAFESLGKFYGKIFSKSQRLKNELNLLYVDESYRNLQTQDLLKNLNENKDIFTETYKLFCLILTIPSTKASVENFSCFKRIKTYLRNAASEDRLSSLANISIQKELLLELIQNQPFYEDIINKFSALEDRRIDLVYKN